MGGWVVAAIVVDPARRAVLLKDRNGPPTARPELPAIELPSGDRDLPSAGVLVDAIEELLRGSVRPLWIRGVQSDDGSRSGVAVVLAAAGPELSTSTGAFVRADAVVDALEPAAARPVVRRWLDGLDGRSDPRTPPWLDPAWHPRATAWTADRMRAAGLPPTGPSRLDYQSELATVFRTPFGDGALFTKCTAPCFEAEPRITQALARRTPEWVPLVIDIEPVESWLLMGDLGGRTLGNEPEPAWADGFAIHARLQRAWVDRTAELLDAGAALRPISQITDVLPRLLEVDGLGDRVDPALRDGWPSMSVRFLEACRELESIGLPDTLVHGDLHQWNIAVTDGGLRIFDWSDGAVAQPFLDLAVFLGRAAPANRRHLLDAYLEPWSDAAPRGSLERAADLSMAVGSVYQVLTYQRLVREMAPEDAAGWENADASWLGNAVRALDDGLDVTFSFGEEPASDPS